MKPLYLECAEPNGGLGNRLTVICSGYATAKLLNREPKLYWKKSGHGCRAEFLELYKIMPEIELVDSVPEGEETFFAWYYGGIAKKFHEQWLGDKLFSEEYWHYYREGAKQIQLIDSIALPEKGNFNALHVRGNYKPRSADSEIYDRFRAEGLFIATDNSEAYDSLMKNATNCWSLSKPKTKFDFMNRDLDSLKEAARDMMMLTKANTLLTIGKDSTFRNLATLGYQVPTFSLYSGESP